MAKLHLGCGPHYIEGMFNVDLRQDVKTDFCGSLFDMFIKNNSIDFIWSCHMLEHLEYPKGIVEALELCYKWLKTGGIIRLAVPDLALVAGHYFRNDDSLFKMYGHDIDEHLYKTHSRAEVFTYFMRGWEHKVVFDFELIQELLADAGFRWIEKMPFRKSKLGEFEHDRFEKESMFVEAVK
jgi:predicted SAM-dependent methyltransferase